MEFLNVDTVEGARAKLLAHAQSLLAATELVPLAEACGRVLGEDVYAKENIPAFRRSTVDGYAVVASDTAAAGDSIPVFLTERPGADMGQPTTITLESGECAEVPTGGMVPDGADAVAMAEYVELFSLAGVMLYESVAFGENVVQIGEDARAGELVCGKGKVLLPQDVGVLAAAGAASVSVYKRPVLTILSTGDELVAPEQSPLPGQVRDVNTYALSALAQKNGFVVVHTAVLADDEAALENALRAAASNSDIVAVSGGSSQGQKDSTKKCIDRVSSPGVFTHGLAVKPGKPTILGFDEKTDTLYIGLPGHPVSAMMIFELLVCWLYRACVGADRQQAIPARITQNAASSPGRLTCWPVRLQWAGEGYEATPIFGKSGLITTLSDADGYILVERDAEGISAGQAVLVNLF